MAMQAVKKRLIHSRLLLFCALVLFDSTPSSLAASRELLIEGAKKKAELILYASMNLEEAKTMISRFEQKYPFVKVKLNRTDNEKLLTKILMEARAKNPLPIPSRLWASQCIRLRRVSSWVIIFHQKMATTPKNSKKRVTGPRFIPTRMSWLTIPG